MKSAMPRGRPKSDGRQPGWMLIRAIIFLAAYKQARDNGTTYAKAIETAVSKVQEVLNCPISSREGKRILSQFHWSNSKSGEAFVSDFAIRDGKPVINAKFAPAKRYARISPEKPTLFPFSRKFQKSA